MTSYTVTRYNFPTTPTRRSPKPLDGHLHAVANAPVRSGAVFVLNDEVRVSHRRAALALADSDRTVQFSQRLASYWRCPEDRIRFCAGEEWKGGAVEWDALPSTQSRLVLAPEVTYGGKNGVCTLVYRPSEKGGAEQGLCTNLYRRVSQQASKNGSSLHVQLPAEWIAAAYTRRGRPLSLRE